MKLLLDLGNSRLKWAVWDGGRLGQTGVTPRRQTENFAELEALPRPEQVVVVSVAGPATDHRLAERIAVLWHLNPRFLKAEAEAAGVINGYRQADRLGVDRWLALIGARGEVDGWTVVVDAGTALTLDVLDPAGVHQGGIIVPGIGLMRRALLAGTAGIVPEDEHQDGEGGWLGRSTGEGVARGTLLAVTACCRRFIDTIAPGQPISCLLTGGDAQQLRPWLEADSRLQVRLLPQLVLQGVARRLQFDNPSPAETHKGN